MNKTVPGTLQDFFGFRPALRDRFLRISGRLFDDFNENRGSLEKTNVFEVGTGVLESLFRISKSQHTRGKDIKNTGKNNMQKKDRTFVK